MSAPVTAFSQGKYVFPSLAEAVSSFLCFISIGSSSPVSAQGFYQSRTGEGRGAGAAPGTGVLLPVGLSLVQLLGGG